MKRRDLLLFILPALILLCIIFFVVWTLLFSGKTFPAEQVSPSPTPAAFSETKQFYRFGPPSPTPTGTRQPTPRVSGPFLITRIHPPEDPFGVNEYSPIAQITFTFNKNVHLSSVRVSSSPSIPLDVKIGGSANEIIVFPEPPEYWVPDTPYTVTIAAGTAADDDSTLSEPVTYKLKARLQGEDIEMAP